MTENPLTLSELAQMNDKQVKELRNDQLYSLLTSGESAANPEKLSSISIMLMWMEKEIQSLFNRPQMKVDREVSADELDQVLDNLYVAAVELEKLSKVTQKYFSAIYALRDTVKVEVHGEDPNFKKKVIDLLDSYVNGFMTLFMEYLEQRRMGHPDTAVPFVTDVKKMSFDLRTLDDETISFIKSFFHDFNNIVVLFIQYTHLFGENKEAFFVGSEHSTIEQLQRYVIEMQEFFLGCDFKNFTYRFKEASLAFTLQNIQSALETKTSESINNKDDILYSCEGVKLDFVRSAFDQSVDLSSFRTKLNGPFVIRLIQNVKQNAGRVNSSLASVNRANESITSVVGNVWYEGRNEKILPNQALIGKLGAWIVLEITDDGPGFPNSNYDRVVNLKNEEVRLYFPTVGRSNHGGEGLGLSRIQQDVITEGGECIFYTPVGGRGATIRVAFPLLKRK